MFFEIGFTRTIKFPHLDDFRDENVVSGVYNFIFGQNSLNDRYEALVRASQLCRQRTEKLHAYGTELWSRIDSSNLEEFNEKQ